MRCEIDGHCVGYVLLAQRNEVAEEGMEPNRGEFDVMRSRGNGVKYAMALAATASGSCGKVDEKSVAGSALVSVLRRADLHTYSSYQRDPSQPPTDLLSAAQSSVNLPADAKPARTPGLAHSVVLSEHNTPNSVERDSAYGATLVTKKVYYDTAERLALRGLLPAVPSGVHGGAAGVGGCAQQRAACEL